MNLTPYVENLRNQLAVAAEAGGPEARALAERLTGPLDSAVRLTLLDVLSAAADEIGRELTPGSVELRLRGREPDFVVTPPSDLAFALDDDDGPSLAPPVPPAPPAAPDGDDGSMTRINVRLPEHLKGRIEQAAGRAGLSVNAWLVRAAAAALGPDRRTERGTDRITQGSEHYTGWVR